MNIPASSGAVVMGTGIVSVTFSLAHHKAISLVLLVLAAAIWVALVLLIASQVMRARASAFREAGTPAALTMVAGTAVLGSRLAVSGLWVTAIALLFIATVLWLGLSAELVSHRQLPSTGTTFMITVAPQSLAVLAATSSAAGHAVWLVWPAMAACALGLVLYPLALRRFEPQELISGSGDHWVAGGALAISALASSEISVAAGRVAVLRGAVPALHTVCVLVWIAGIVWLPVLVACELASPRIGYQLPRWSTVFPVGMYGACSFTVARAAGLPALRSVAGFWTWVSLAVWLAVAGGMIARGVQVVAGRPKPAAPS